MSSLVELKPCPLCGSTKVGEIPAALVPNRGTAMCDDCGCNAHTTAWNTRAHEAETRQALEMARKALLSASTLYEAAGLQYVRDAAIIEAVHCSVEVSDIKQALITLSALLDGEAGKEGE